MLKFVHADGSNKELLWHRWPFVYLHGEAERMNLSAYAEGGEAPNICVASESMDHYAPCVGNGLPCESWSGTVSIPCEVNGQPAVCVLSSRSVGFGGRIALVKDFKALQHTMRPEDWR